MSATYGNPPLWELHVGDCLDVLKTLPDCSVDAVVNDPPYLISFMSANWDSADGIAGKPEVWREVLRVLKPGGHLLAFGATRTYHRMVCAVEDAGFEIRDTISWLYGSGFPKSRNISVAVDKAAGAEREVVGPAPHADKGRKGNLPVGATTDPTNKRLGPSAESVITAPATALARQWDGWGTALKPAMELITLARKPFPGTVAANVEQWGTGALNVDGCRIPSAEKWQASGELQGGESLGRYGDGLNNPGRSESHADGRWPANVIHDDSEEVEAAFARFGESVSTGGKGAATRNAGAKTSYGWERGETWQGAGGYSDAGSVARFFYTAKASPAERGHGNNHPCVKPLSLMQYLCRLICPPGGVVLDPFCGSGTTGIAALIEGFRFIGIEREEGYAALARRRICGAKIPLPGMFDSEESQP